MSFGVCHCARGEVDEIVEGKISVIWSVISDNSIVGSYAGLRWSMETTDSLPLMFNIKRLLVHLTSLN